MVGYDAGGQRFQVADALDTTVNPLRYGLKTFDANGNFLQAVSLQPAGKNAPLKVDGIAFDLAGTPFFTWRDTDLITNDHHFDVYKVYGGSVLLASTLPFNNVEDAGPSTVGSSGNDLISEATIRLDPNRTNKTDVTGGTLYLGRGTEVDPPQALVTIPDPLVPTVRMAFAPSGDLFLAGPRSDGTQGIKRVVTSSQAAQDVPLTVVGGTPDGLWVGQDGDLYLVTNGNGQAAHVRRYDESGTLLGESDVKITGGSYLAAVTGLVQDNPHRLVIAGTGFDASGKAMQGLYAFAI